MSYPRLARPVHLLVAVLAVLASVFTLAPAATAAQPLCGWTKAHHTCVTGVSTIWKTDTAARIYVGTDTPTTLRMEYQPAYYGNAKTVYDNTVTKSHFVTITNLKPGWTQYLDVFAKATDGTVSWDPWDFKTMHHRLSVRVDEVDIDNDGDNIGAGEIHAAMRLNSDDGDMASPVVFPRQASTGQVIKVGQTWNYLDRPLPSVLQFGVVDLDDDDCLKSWGNPRYIANHTFGTSCGDAATVYQTLPISYNGKEQHMMIFAGGPVGFRAYITVWDELIES